MNRSLPAAALFMAAFLPLSLHAQLSFQPGYGASTLYTHGNADAVVSFDWGSDGALYYMASTASYTFGGLYQAGVSSALVAGNAEGSGASVAGLGTSLYYNTNDAATYAPKISRFDLTSRTPDPGAAGVPNYSLLGQGGSLFIAGAENFTTGSLYSLVPGAGGSLAGRNPVKLGEIAGASGPLAFDAAGNLFYAPGYGNKSIYRFSAEKVQLALADPTLHPLTAAGNLWYDYSGGADFTQTSGGTAMTVDAAGNLLLTLTSFSAPSLLVNFGRASLATSAGGTTIFSDADRLGDLRLHEGTVYFSSGNTVYGLVPEPTTGGLLLLGGLLCCRRRERRPLGA